MDFDTRPDYFWKNKKKEPHTRMRFKKNSILTRIPCLSQKETSTFRTFLSKLGVSREVSEKCMNHSLKGVEKTYDCYGFFPERVKALNKLSEYVAPLLNYKPLITATVG